MNPEHKIYNKEFFQEAGNIFLELAKRHKVPLSLAIIDIDNLAEINEDYGLNHGDNIIKKISEILLDNSRKSDLVSYDGEGKFSLLLYNISGINANITLDSLRQKIVSGINQSKKMNTVTIGASIIYSHMENETLKTLYDKANIALRNAKDQGKNKVLIY